MSGTKRGTKPKTKSELLNGTMPTVGLGIRRTQVYDRLHMAYSGGDARTDHLTRRARIALGLPAEHATTGSMMV